MKLKSHFFNIKQLNEFMTHIECDRLNSQSLDVIIYFTFRLNKQLS